MVHRFGYYKINSHVNDVWNKNLAFWQRKKCKILDQFISKNSLYGELKVKHGISGHLYGTSMGETYDMKFGYHPQEGITYVSVDIDFSMLGRGFIWLVPKNIMKEWANEMGIQPVKLIREKDRTYRTKFDEIINMNEKQVSSKLQSICPACGNENELKTKICPECGTNLEEICVKFNGL